MGMNDYGDKHMTKDGPEVAALWWKYFLEHRND